MISDVKRGRPQTYRNFKFSDLEIGESFTIGLPDNSNYTYNLVQNRMRGNLRSQIRNGNVVPWTKICIVSYLKNGNRRLRCYRTE